jgi:hypothetical protein
MSFCTTKLNARRASLDIGKNSFHIVGHDERGAIVLRQKWSRGQVEARFSNMTPCLTSRTAVLSFFTAIHNCLAYRDG